MGLKVKTIALLFFTILPNASKGQLEEKLGTWNILNVKYNFNEKVSVFGEGQLRSLKLYQNFHYYEYKIGFSYKINKSLNFTIGTGSYQTYQSAGDFSLPKSNDEIRLWPQISLYQSLGRFKIEQRYRTEFRFSNNTYKNRYRYRFGVSYPFGKNASGSFPYQLNVSNELFFTDRVPYFERVRLSIALNYRVAKATTFQIGYLYQFDYKLTDETGREFLQIGFFFELFKKKRETESHPVEMSIKDN